jgi:hypothetical protein
MRSWLYMLARLLGDINAVSRGPSAIAKRIVRKSALRGAGSFITRLFR